MSTILKKIMLLFLSAMMILSAGCSNKGNQTSADNQNKAMGRYVEKTLEFPIKDVRSLFSIVKRSDGTFDFYLFKDTEPCLVMYNTSDGLNWNKKDIPWYEDLINMQYENLIKIVYDKNDNIYVLASGSAGEAGFVNKLFKITDNSPKEIKIDWEKSDVEGVGVYITDMQITDGDDILFSQATKGIMKYNFQGKFLYKYGNTDGETFTVSGDNIIVKNQDSSAFDIYDINTDEQIKSVSYDNLTHETAISSGEDGSVYLTDRSGVYRLAAGGSLWEKIIDGELSSLSIPSLYFSGITECKDGTYFIGYEDAESECKLIKYEYDENISTLPGTELVVYTLEENRTLRQAAGELQHKNSDVKVNIKVGMDKDSSITKTDAIKALNTELLAGKGPDLILLDRLPVDSYISKGVLEDLSDIIKDLDENEEKFLDNVINTYNEDGKIMAVPAKFFLPSMWLDDEYSEEIKNLDDLADFAEEHSDKMIISISSAENLIKLFSLTCAPYWTDDKGDIKEAEFSEFLSDLKRINNVNKKFDVAEGNNDDRGNSNTPRGQAIVDSMNNSTNVFEWAFNRSYTYCDILKSYNSLNLPSLAVNERNGGTAVPLPGQLNEVVFVPTNVIGLNANSNNKEIAKSFIKIMLSPEVQDAKIYDGFPANIKSLEHGAISSNDNLYFGITNDKGEELDGPMPTVEELKKINELCLLVTTPSVVDETLLEMIIDETKGYFDGEETIELAVKQVKEKTKLYISE